MHPIKGNVDEISLDAPTISSNSLLSLPVLEEQGLLLGASPCVADGSIFADMVEQIISDAFL